MLEHEAPTTTHHPGCTAPVEASQSLLRESLMERADGDGHCPLPSCKDPSGKVSACGCMRKEDLAVGEKAKESPDPTPSFGVFLFSLQGATIDKVVP